MLSLKQARVSQAAIYPAAMKKAKITIETERLLVVTRSRRTVENWCPTCRDEVRMIGVEEAAAIVGVSQRTMFRSLEAGRVHFAETSRGALLICLNSVLKQTGERKNAAGDR